jgi:hypothetical protein
MLVIKLSGAGNKFKLPQLSKKLFSDMNNSTLPNNNWQPYFKKISLTVAVFFSRFLRVLPNFSPVGSFGFFQSNILLFFGQIIIYDKFFSGFYPGFIFTYIGFASYYLWGRLAKGQVKKQVLFLPIASFCFFIFSNFGVWLFWYPRSLAGLLSCYLAALPFYRNTLLGDVFFGGLVIIYQLLMKNFIVQKNIAIALSNKSNN